MRTSSKGLSSSLLIAALMAGLTLPASAQDTSVNFGDDTSEWANDGECDDPRFAGENMAEELEAADTLKDATDCQTLFDAGKITLAETADEADAAGAVARAEAIADAEIDFGDDSSEWANDGECDDPRFTGAKMATELLPEDALKDATDCKALFDAGDITLADGGGDASLERTSIDDIDFGDDSSQWANDLECDDPRFAGPGMNSALLPEDEKADASDCREAYEDGTVHLVGEGEDEAATPVRSAAATASLEAIARRIDFGDDSGEWANDGECDDPDFFGPGASNLTDGGTRSADASDCRAAFLTGDVSFKTVDQLNVAFDFGDDSSRWANDGECDDPRFAGTGLNKKMLFEDIMSDASDCEAQFNAGSVTIKPVYTPEYALGAPYDSSEIDFGDDTSSYANDGQCDDPRFEGPGVAGTVFESDTRADATDCKSAYETGKAMLIDAE
ncbi:hypothetical protein [Devosia sp. MC1541]|uniref:hypothetical protein n=1 Tax=Devosia sp. MC1541 TaxID=2725264 RepID=UPI00145C9E6E|nr:hypothetical protein [Devosia sp. MC1541]